MRWPLLLLALTGCDKLFSVTEVPQPDSRANGTNDGTPADGSEWGASCFDGTFTTAPIDTSVFFVTLPAAGDVRVDQQAVTISLPTAAGTTANYGSVETQHTYDLTDGMVSVELLEIPGTNAEDELILMKDGSHKYVITVGSGEINFDLYNGSSSIFSTQDTFAYTLPAPRFLRMHHESATSSIVYEVSKDGTNWTTATHPAVFGVADLEGQFDAGTYDTSANPGKGRFDNFELRSHSCL